MKVFDSGLKRMNLGEILDYSIEVYKRNFKKVTLLALIIHVPFMFLYTLLSGYLSGDMMNIFGNVGELDETALSGSMYMLAAYYFSLFAIWIVYGVYTVTLKAVMDSAIAKVIYQDVVYRKELTVRQALRESFRKIASLAGNRLLYGLILLGIGMAAYIALVIIILILIAGSALIGLGSGLEGAMNTTSDIAAGIVAVFAILLLVAGLGLFVAYFAVKYLFGLHAVALEGKTAAGGLTRSGDLTRKSFWHVAFCYLFGSLLVYTVPSLLTVGASMLILVNLPAYIAAITGVQVINAVIYPFMAIVTTMVFINMKVQKEGLDLELKVDILLEEQKASEALENTEGQGAADV